MGCVLALCESKGAQKYVKISRGDGDGYGAADGG